MPNIHSAQHLLQVLEQDDFARSAIAPKNGIKKSSFSEATNDRGLEQFMFVYQNLQTQALNILPQQNPELGNLVSIDGSLIRCHFVHALGRLPQKIEKSQGPSRF